MKPPTPLRRPFAAVAALAAVLALLAPAVVASAGAPAAEAPCGMGADSCPLAAAAACRTMECCARPAAPPRPQPIERAAPAPGPQLVVSPPASGALVAPPPPPPPPLADDRPLHGSALAVPLFTLHASFLI
jgi:hypothetical protein